ncbi:unnamed protein product [Auanema sp. JU1783]|nr:unnamed protein product [Auanema sp. JU1783]
MPVSPYPHFLPRGGPDVRSQASGASADGSGSGSEHRRNTPKLGVGNLRKHPLCDSSMDYTVRSQPIPF